jgi:hypothetical protein
VEGWRARLRTWWVWLAGTGAGALIVAAAVVQITGISLRDIVSSVFHGGSSPQVSQTSPSPEPTLSPTVAPSPTVGTPTPTPATAAPPVAPATTSGLPIQAFEGQWTWPNHEAFGLRGGDILATGDLTYYGPGPVPAGQVAKIRFTSRTGDTLNGTVETVGPGTYQFKPGDPASVTLTNAGQTLQLAIGRNNPASGTLSRV